MCVSVRAFFFQPILGLFFFWHVAYLWFLEMSAAPGECKFTLNLASCQFTNLFASLFWVIYQQVYVSKITFQCLHILVCTLHSVFFFLVPFPSSVFANLDLCVGVLFFASNTIVKNCCNVSPTVSSTCTKYISMFWLVARCNLSVTVLSWQKF